MDAGCVNGRSRQEVQADRPRLVSIQEASFQLGGISVWTLRKHISRGNVRVTRLGRRTFLPEEEITRIQQEGLPSLTLKKLIFRGGK